MHYAFLVAACSKASAGVIVALILLWVLHSNQTCPISNVRKMFSYYHFGFMSMIGSTSVKINGHPVFLPAAGQIVVNCAGIASDQ